MEKRKTVVETRKSMAAGGGLAAAVKAVQEQVASAEAAKAPAAPVEAKAPAGRFAVGATVLGCFPEDGAWYDAKILAKRVSLQLSLRAEMRAE